MSDIKWFFILSLRRYFAPIVGACKGIVAEYQRLDHLEHHRESRNQ